MIDRDLPISERRLAELREPLSDDAQMVLELVLFGAAGLEDEEKEEWKTEIEERVAELAEEDRSQLLFISEELKKAYDRNIRENEAVMDSGERAMADITAARRFDPTVNTAAEAAPVLRKHGIELRMTEADQEVQIQIPAEPEWVSIPASEIDTDENGIPTKAASRKGWAFKAPSSEVFKFDRKEVDALRLLAKHRPYAEYLVDREATGDTAEAYKAFYGDLLEIGLAEEDADKQARELVDILMHTSYLQSLVHIIREEPELQGLLDCLKNKDTAAARRYKERAAKEVITRLHDEYTDELIEAGVLEEVEGTNGQMLRPGPNYEEWKREVKEKRGEG